MSIIKFRSGSTTRFREYSTITLRGTDGVDNPPVIYYDSNKTAYIDVYDIMYETYYYIKEKIINALQIKVEDDIDGIITDKLDLYLNKQYRSDGRYSLGIWPSNELRVIDSSLQITEEHIDIHVTKSKEGPILNVSSSNFVTYRGVKEYIHELIKNKITVSDYYYLPDEINITVEDRSNSSGIYTAGSYYIPVYATDPSGNVSQGNKVISLTVYNKPGNSEMKWEHIGYRDYYHSTYNIYSNNSYCYSSSELLNILTNEVNPNNYEYGHVIRVNHTHFDPDTKAIVPCGYYYFRAMIYIKYRKWKYIGTNSSYNGSYDAGGFVNGCLSSSSMLNIITNRLDPSDYRVGYILRVTHYTYLDYGDISSPPIDCTTYYYINVEVSERITE